MKQQQRHNLIMCVVGKQGVGKTYQTKKELLCAYVKGSKILIFEPNDDAKMKAYTSEEILEAAKIVKASGAKVRVALAKYKNSSPQKAWKIMRLPYHAQEEDGARRAWAIAKFSKSKGYGIRRISPLLNAKEVEENGAPIIEMSREQLKVVAEDILKHFRPIDAGKRNGVVLLDDVNKYLLSMHNQKDFVGSLMNIRHRGSDYYLHYHDVMQIPPVLYRFSGLIRLHKAVQDIRKAQKIPYEYLKLAECIVNVMRQESQYSFVYVYAAEGLICGASEKEYREGCKEFLRFHPAMVKAYGGEKKTIDNYLMQWYKPL